MDGRIQYEIYQELTASKLRWDDLLPGERDAWARVLRASRTPEAALQMLIIDARVIAMEIRAKCPGCGHVWKFTVEKEGTQIECPDCSGVVRARNKVEREREAAAVPVADEAAAVSALEV